MTEKIYETYSPEETHALGKRLGAEAKPGDVYTLVGDCLLYTSDAADE